MLLGASGQANGLDVDLAVAIDPTRSGDAGVPDGDVLLAFASAANRRSDDTKATRQALAGAVGDEGVLEAAATIAIFNGLVRVADGTGIQLDPAMLTSTAEQRSTLGIDGFAGAQNSVGASGRVRRTSADPVRALFD